jgi:hypothetical protein
VIEMKSKFGGLLFFLILLIAIFGIISFSAEFFLGKPLLAVLKDFLFVVQHKQ